MKITSNAKINLGLNILGQRSDGYHNLQSIFIEVDFADKLTFTPSTSFSLTTNGIHVPTDESNIITQAYRKMEKFAPSTKQEYHIHLEKNIPIGAGLGGGSSNAASVNTALNSLWELNLPSKKQKEIAVSLGADVPFFIDGKVQLAEGIGDVLSPIDSTFLNDKYILLVFPEFSVSTAWAYGEVKKVLTPSKEVPKLVGYTSPVKWQLFENDFELVIRSTYPEIENIKTLLLQQGALFGGLSGSGSTLFGIFDNLERAETASSKFTHLQTQLTSPVLT